jgi:haloalkane dehalogenase
MRYEKKKISVLGSDMAYVDTGSPGDGRDPIVFLHGNVTSSYMWRNIMPYVEPYARVVAVDNIGQGDSAKLPDSGPGRYRLAEHQRYTDAIFDKLGLGDHITLMVHDWGGSLGFTWAMNHPDRIKGLAYMQTLMGDQRWTYWPPHVSDLMRRFKSPEGEKIVLEDNYFVEHVLPGMTIRRMPEEVMDEYRRPYRIPGEDRRPTLSWPREIPVEGEPADVLETINRYVAWLAASPVPKLFIHTEPGAVLKDHLVDLCRTFPNQTEVTVKGLHYVHEDSPHEIGAALAAWYTGLS